MAFQAKSSNHPPPLSLLPSLPQTLSGFDQFLLQLEEVFAFLLSSLPGLSYPPAGGTVSSPLPVASHHRGHLARFSTCSQGTESLALLKAPCAQVAAQKRLVLCICYQG